MWCDVPFRIAISDSVAIATQVFTGSGKEADWIFHELWYLCHELQYSRDYDLDNSIRVQSTYMFTLFG